MHSVRFINTTTMTLCALLALVNCSQATEPQASRANGNAGLVTTISPGEHGCLSEAIYFEANATAPAQAAVAHVVMNRARDPRFPPSVCGVIRDGCQFSYRCSGKPLALKDARKRDGALRAAAAALSGAPDPTGGALFFHAASVRPGWFATRSRVGDIGDNVFYR